MTRSLVGLLLGVMLVGCPKATDRSLQGDYTGNTADTTSALEAMRKAKQAQDEAERACRPLRDETLSSTAEQQLGRGVALQLLARYGEPLAEPSRTVARVGQVLAKHSSRPALTWTFGVLEAEEDRLYGEPGGYVFMTRGALAAAKDDAGIAARLAHEVAHVTAGDATRQQQQLLYSRCVAARVAPLMMKSAAAMAGHDALLSDGGVGPGFSRWIADSSLEFSQLQHFTGRSELEADATAARLLVFSGYPLEPYAQWLASLPKVSEARLQAFEREAQGLEPLRPQAR